MKAILLFSGGLDSTTLLYWLLGNDTEVECISFDYGQRHLKENYFAARTARRLGVPHRILPLGGVGDLLRSGSVLLDRSKPVPEGHYAATSMVQTIVPYRNMIMLSIALGMAEVQKATAVFFAAHTGDHSIYPDCREEFVQAMNQVARLYSWDRGVPILINAPFMEKTKVEIVKLGQKLGVPWEDTWSCYRGESLHCGKCGTCHERKEAFRLTGVLDPTIYQDIHT